jgi:hypothetical protein
MGMYRHDALPKPGSVTRESDGATVDGSTPADYPLLATCGPCNRQIRITASQGTDWKHVRTPVTPIAGAAS